MSDDYDYSFDYSAIDQARVFTIVIATISALFPLSVAIILIQRYNTLVRGKTLVHYVLCIAIADTLTAIFIAFGYPRGGSVACSIQAFFGILSTRSSWFYTDVLMIQLFSVVVFKQYFLTIKYMHCIVWSLNLLLQALPFTTGVTYGNADYGIPINACNLTGGEGKYDNHFWVQFTINIEVIISFSLIIILSLVIAYISLTSTFASEAYLAPRIRDSWSLVILYPGAMLVAWVPSQAYAFYFSQVLNAGQELPPHIFVKFNYLLAISALYGVFLSLIFYTKTQDARRAWLSNMRYIYRIITNKDVDIGIDDRSTCSSILSIDDRSMSGMNRLSLLHNQINDPDSTIANPIKNNVPVNRITTNDTSDTIRITEAL